MDIEQLHNEYHRILDQYNLKDKADEIADYLIKTKNVSSGEFAKLFAMSEQDAVLFLKYLHKGIEYQKENQSSN